MWSSFSNFFFFKGIVIDSSLVRVHRKFSCLALSVCKNILHFCFESLPSKEGTLLIKTEFWQGSAGYNLKKYF